MSDKVLGQVFDALWSAPPARIAIILAVFLTAVVVPIVAPLWRALWELIYTLRIGRARAFLELRKIDVETRAVMKEKGVALPAHEERAATAPWRELLAERSFDIPGKSSLERTVNWLAIAASGWLAPLMAQALGLLGFELVRRSGVGGWPLLLTAIFAVVAPLAGGWAALARLARKYVGDAARYVHVGAIGLIGYEMVGMLFR